MSLETFPLVWAPMDFWECPSKKDVIEALQAEHRRTALLRIEELRLAAEQANIPINIVEREEAFPLQC